MSLGALREHGLQTAAIVQQTLVLVCWLTERYLVEGRAVTTRMKSRVGRGGQEHTGCHSQA